MGQPVVGASWEGFVIETLLSAAPQRSKAYFYRTAAGAEIDLVLDMGTAHGLWAIEIKRGLAAKIEKGFMNTREDVAPARSFIVYGGEKRYPKGDGIEAIGLADLLAEIRSA